MNNDNAQEAHTTTTNSLQRIIRTIEKALPMISLLPDNADDVANDDFLFVVAVVASNSFSCTSVRG